jgi:membrane fusion protein (multidrug efflux system)
MKRKWIVTTVVIVVFIAGAVLYRVLGKPSSDEAMGGPASSPRGQSVLHVGGEIIHPQLLTEGINTVANLLPDEEVDLAFETSGKIVGIFFQEGAPVQKGQLLAKINDAPLQAQLARYQSQVKLAEARVSRQSTLLEKDAVSQEAFEQAATDLAILNAEIDLVRANIAQTELRAPFDGIIGLRDVSAGAYASPSTVIAHLTKISPLKLEFPVPERYASELKVGTPLTFTVDGFLDSFDAAVYATDARVNIDTRDFLARASFPNAGGVLRPGYYARVELRRIEIPDAISVPSEALIMEMGLNKVYLYQDGKAQPQTVQTGIRTAGRVQVLEGLQPGDTLITSGTLQLRTGMSVVLDKVE